MPVDSSIALGIQPAKFDNPMNMLAQGMQLKGMQQEQGLNALKADEYRRTASENNLLNDAYKNALGADGSIDRTKLYSSMAQGGLGSKLPGVQKSFMDVDKSKVDLEKQQVEGGLKKFEFISQILSASKDQVTYDEGRQAAKSVGIDLSFLPAAYDPAVVGRVMQQGQSLKEQMEQKWKALSFTTPDANARLSAETSTANNKRTVSASLDNANATRDVARATRDAAQTKGNQDTEMKLGDDYRAQSKNFKETADAYKQISAVLDKATTSPAATLAGATKFMKMIDPGSVVRESELGMALAATGIFDRASNYFNTLQSGRVLTPAQVKDFKAITKQINDAASQQQKLVDNHFSGIAKQYGLRPEMVVQDYGQNASAEVPKPSNARAEADKILGLTK